ncbi:MAG: bifunctional folylpolyglutamate synthase/dihydrofolate synthase [Acidibacillus sp.]|nr:bifunctional folylpolyglutamate synthase/dihydrofolate synthase [Acidibacillus sp.]
MGLSLEEQSAIAYIQSRARFGMKPGLQRIAYLLQHLGSPEKQLRFIHVAGTNGKGSTCVYAASMLQAAGYRVGLYTSPYLTAFAERMSVNGEAITASELIALTKQVQLIADTVAGNKELEPTEFEIITAIAFLFFLSRKVDLVVLEAGLGGRFDATNVVLPEVCAITNVDLDHTEILGKNVREIAFDKSGIIKSNVPVVTGAQHDALDVIQQVAKKQHSDVWMLHNTIRVVPEYVYDLAGQRFSYMGRFHDWLGLRLNMLGIHQVSNAGVALGLMEVLSTKGYTISEQAIRVGLKTAVWPGRLEVIHKDPVVILDGAHNKAGAVAMARALEDLSISRYVLVMGVLSDKDMDGMSRAIVPKSSYVIVTKPAVQRSTPTEVLASFVRNYAGEVPVELVEDVSQAVQRGVSIANQKAVALCIMGSLYTVAEAKMTFLQS